MANVTINADRVLDRVNLSNFDVKKEKVEVFIDDAITTIENELGVTIGELAGDAGSKSLDVDKKYAPVITNLSAIYCICFVTGGAYVGMTFSIGDLNVSAVTSAPPIDILYKEVERVLGAEQATSLEPIALIVGKDES